MSPSTKNLTDLDELKTKAEELLAHRQEILSDAGTAAREAASKGAELGGKAASKAGDVISHTVIPAVGSAIGTALSVADVAKDARVQAALKRVAGVPSKAPKKKGGFGKVVLLTLGIAAVAGVAYAVWQTFRADDELWVADELNAPSPE